MASILAGFTPVSIVVHPTQGDQPLAPHWPPKMSQRKWVRPQHRTGSLYSGSSQGVDWPTQLFRQWPVLGLGCRARGTST